MSRLTRLAHPRISSADALLGKAAPEVTESDATGHGVLAATSVGYAVVMLDISIVNADYCMFIALMSDHRS
jgi:hypothetical protein